MDSPARQALLEDLARRIRQVEAREHPRDRLAIPLGIPALEDYLPEGGLPAGSLVELLSVEAGVGTWTLALLLAQRVCGERKVLVVADTARCFYPPAAVNLGVDLARCIVVRPISVADAAMAMRQALECAAVGAAIGWLDPLNPPACRRLQLAAEAGGGVGLVLRPSAARATPSFAALRLLIAPVPAPGFPRCLRAEVVRCRGGKVGQTFILEIDDATGHVRVPAGVAPPALGAHERRASG